MYPEKVMLTFFSLRQETVGVLHKKVCAIFDLKPERVKCLFSKILFFSFSVSHFHLFLL